VDLVWNAILGIHDKSTYPPARIAWARARSRKCKFQVVSVSTPTRRENNKLQAQRNQSLSCISRSSKVVNGITMGLLWTSREHGVYEPRFVGYSLDRLALAGKLDEHDVSTRKMRCSRGSGLPGGTVAGRQRAQIRQLVRVREDARFRLSWSILIYPSSGLPAGCWLPPPPCRSPTLAQATQGRRTVAVLPLR
jgi:hypothetical protein